MCSHMRKFSDQFKNESLKKTVGVLREKYQQQDEKQQNVKQMSQNEIINTLEMEKSLEKDEKTRANYDAIIKFIKNWWANKLSDEYRKEIQRIVLQAMNDKVLAQKALICTEKHKNLEALAKYFLGKQFVENLKKSNAFVRSQSSGWVKKLT